MMHPDVRAELARRSLEEMVASGARRHQVEGDLRRQVRPVAAPTRRGLLRLRLWPQGSRQ
jgi:hypothetical protein